MRVGRLIFIIIILFLAAFSIIFRLVYFQTEDKTFLDQQGNSRMVRTVNEHAFRGKIVDRNGYPLAISTPVDSIWADPKFVELNNPKTYEVFNLLSLSIDDKKEILERIKKRLGRYGFVYLKRKVPPYIAEKIEQMEVPGIHLMREYQRYYPDGEVTAHVVGFTNIDNQGVEGIELVYNNWLDGHSGQYEMWRDLKRNLIKKTKTIKDKQTGGDIALSIDRQIQYIAYRALKRSIIENNAIGGSVVVLDAHTGEVLAMVNQPSFNPNNLSDSEVASRRNRAITDVFEPGSTIKTISVLAGVEYGGYSPDDVFDVSPGYYYLNKLPVRDFRNYGELDLRHVMMKSSNVGISRMLLTMPKETLPNLLRTLGFGRSSGLEAIGERSGYVPMNMKKVSDFSLATLSFGYGMNSTALQLARAYAALANGGKLVRPTLLRISDKSQVESVQVIKPKAATQTLDMLTSVVEAPGGTGSKAKIEGYQVAGKTGTVRKPIPGGYATDAYMGLFAGIIPADNPNYVIVVVIDDPKGESYGGGTAAAPVFSEIAEQILRLKALTPTKLITS
ncbi:penicillin-binding protein 2 [Thiotrichales bacterium 19S3-7]|nr:penicillin-binding protein 2 [Thiotrichales bacterium 19S3-7]MCF6802449.1 penicillin-binding protein 2 [Thiotrichales bacterium 19S3-11]